MAVTGPEHQWNAPSDQSELNVSSQLANLKLRSVEVQSHAAVVVAVSAVASGAVFLLFAVSSFPAVFEVPGCWDVY